MSNSIPAQSGSITPIEPEGKNFRGQLVKINANQKVTRTYDDTLHNLKIDVVEGVLKIYSGQEVTKTVVRNRQCDVKIGDNIVGAGDEGVTFVETYRK